MTQLTRFDHVPQRSATGDMEPEAFRRYGHQVVDWIAQYLTGAGSYPVLAQTAPGTLRRSLPSSPPLQPEPMEAILADFERLLLPGITHWNSGRFLAYFGLGGSAPSLLGYVLAGALNPTRMLWRTCPAATELEQVTLDWLRQLLGLPQPLFGMIHHNSAITIALHAAREALPDLSIRALGLAGRPEVPRLRYYASQQAHVSVEKAGMELGLGQAGLRKIGVDDAFRMDVAELEWAIAEDLAQGWRPFAVVATVGTTSTTSIDPVPQIADICQRSGLWLHVDAAYAGAAALVPELRWVLAGCDRADTLTVNPHKWLFTPFGCSVLYSRKSDLVKSAYSLSSDYLEHAEDAGEVVPNLMDYCAYLPHGFPALALWMVLRYFGQQGLAARIREHCRLAHLAAQWIQESEHFELLALVPLSVVCFRAHPRGMDDEAQLDALNERLLSRLNTAGHFFLSHSRLHGKYAIRLAIGNIRTTEQDVRGVWEELQHGCAAIISAALGAS